MNLGVYSGFKPLLFGNNTTYSRLPDVEPIEERDRWSRIEQDERKRTGLDTLPDTIQAKRWKSYWELFVPHTIISLSALQALTASHAIPSEGIYPLKILNTGSDKYQIEVYSEPALKALVDTLKGR